MLLNINNPNRTMSPGPIPIFLHRDCRLMLLKQYLGATLLSNDKLVCHASKAPIVSEVNNPKIWGNLH